MSIFKKKTAAVGTYDQREWKAVLRCSICNGEQVAGFKNLRTGKFEEIMLIRDEAALREFKERYGVNEIIKEY